MRSKRQLVCVGLYPALYDGLNGRIRLSASTASRTYELSEETHMTPFRTYRFHSTGLSNYKP